MKMMKTRTEKIISRYIEYASNLRLRNRMNLMVAKTMMQNKSTLALKAGTVIAMPEYGT